MLMKDDVKERLYISHRMQISNPRNLFKSFYCVMLIPLRILHDKSHFISSHHLSKDSVPSLMGAASPMQVVSSL